MPPIFLILRAIASTRYWCFKADHILRVYKNDRVPFLFFIHAAIALTPHQFKYHTTPRNNPNFGIRDDFSSVKFHWDLGRLPKLGKIIWVTGT